QRLEEVVRVACVVPQPAVHHAAAVRRVAAEGRELPVRNGLERGGGDPERDADPLDERERVVPVEAREQRRDGEERGQKRLRLEEDRERELLSPLLPPAASELPVARVLALAQPVADERGDPEVLDPHWERDREPLHGRSGRERRVEDRAEDERRAPAGVDDGRVARPPLPEIEDGEQDGGGRPAEQPELPAVSAHVPSLPARASSMCASRSAGVRNAASQKAR